MKKIIFLLSFILSTAALTAQVAINSNGENPDASAMLDIKSGSKGVLIPRMTEADRDGIASAATGLLIYQTDADSGFYYNSASSGYPVEWQRLSTGSTPVHRIQDSDDDTQVIANDDDRIFFNTDGVRRMTIMNDGDIGIGTSSPAEKLDVDGKIMAEDGLMIDNASGSGVSIVSAQTHGVYVVDAQATGFYINDAVQNGVAVGDAGVNGFYVGNAGNDGVGVYSAGNPSFQKMSGFNSGVEVGGAEHYGLFVGYSGWAGVMVDSSNNGLKVENACLTGVYVINAGNDGYRVHKVGNPSFTTGGTSKNGFEVNGAQGNGLSIGRSDENGVKVNSAGNDGIQIGLAGEHGVYVNESGKDAFRVWHAGNPSSINVSSLNNGLEIQGAEGNGLYVGRADNSGVYIHESGNDGVDVVDAGSDGVIVRSAGDNLFQGGTEGSEVFTVTNTGAVTIGNDDQWKMLNVMGESVFSSDIYLRDEGITSGDYLVRMWGNSDDGLIDIYENNTVMARIYGAGDSYFNGGNLGIGTTSPSQLLHVNGGKIQIGTGETIEDGGTYQIAFNSNLRPTVDNSRDLGTSTYRWDDVYATNGTINTSDKRDKQNIRKTTYGLDEILKLKPVSFIWKDKPQQGEKLGLIAQDLLIVIPEVVKTEDWQENEETGQLEKVQIDRLGVYYSDLIPVLIKGMQEQQEIIEQQQQQIDQQNQTNNELFIMINKLAKDIGELHK